MNENKFKKIAAIALIFSLAAFAQSGSSVISLSNIEQTLFNEINLLDQSPYGESTRQVNTFYWTTDHDIQLLFFLYTSSPPDNPMIWLEINDTAVLYQKYNPVSGDNYISISTIIPAYSKYNIGLSGDYDSYEWREFTFNRFGGGGTNGTIGYNGTNGINGTSYNQTEFNTSMNLKINKTGDFVDNNFSLTSENREKYIIFDSVKKSLTNGIDIGLLTNKRKAEVQVFPWYINLYLRQGITTNQNYNFSSAGLDMDSKNISNCGNCPNISEAQYNNNMNTKVNKSGDNIKYLNINTTDIKLYQGDLSGTNLSTLFFDSYDSPATTFAFRAFRNGGTSTQFYGYAGNSISGMIHRFALRGSNGNETIPSDVKSGQQLQFDFQGYGNGGYNTASTRIENKFLQNGSAGKGADMDFYATSNNSTLTKFLSGHGDGNITIIGLIGSGNAYACVDSTGKLYRGSPTC